MRSEIMRGFGLRIRRFARSRPWEFDSLLREAIYNKGDKGSRVEI